jgi:hypothetical protein
MGMKKIRLRTKFLLSLLAITAGLSTATLLIVGYSVQAQIRAAVHEDLRNSVNTYRSFERLREASLSRSAELLADLPTVRALMTTQDAATIQDASADLWRLSGSDLLVLANRSGQVVALRPTSPGFTNKTAQELLSGSLQKGSVTDWWFSAGHLYEVWIQPIVFGSQSQNTTLGYLAVGHEINQQAARVLGNVAASEVAFRCDDRPVASTLASAQQAELEPVLHEAPAHPDAEPRELRLGSERYLLTTVVLSPVGGPAVTLTVL